MTLLEPDFAPIAAEPRVVAIGSGQALVVPLGDAHEVISWAIVNGGRRRADTVVWREVGLDELGPEVDARALMHATLDTLCLPEAVGLLTARDVRSYEEEGAECDGVRARCIATVGLGNALAAGDAPNGTPHIGTINILCQVSVALSEEALIETCALSAESRAAALLAAGVRSFVSGRPASGTGTDCIVVAAPVAQRREAFAGKHTACGAAVGAAVHRAVERGARKWLEENACPPR